MSRRKQKKKPVYTLWGTFWRLALGGVLLAAASGAASYVATERLIRRPEVMVPSLISLELEEALERASSEGFAVKLDGEEASNLLAQGHVLAQRPSPEMWAKEGATIHVTVAARP